MDRVLDLFVLLAELEDLEFVLDWKEKRNHSEVVSELEDQVEAGKKKQSSQKTLESSWIFRQCGWEENSHLFQSRSAATDRENEVSDFFSTVNSKHLLFHLLCTWATSPISTSHSWRLWQSFKHEPQQKIVAAITRH